MLALGSSSGSLQIVGLPALSLGQGPHPLFNGIRRVEIAGFVETPEINESEGGLTIESGSLKMAFTNASLVRDGSTIRITLKVK